MVYCERGMHQPYVSGLEDFALANRNSTSVPAQSVHGGCNFIPVEEEGDSPSPSEKKLQLEYHDLEFA